MFTDTGSLMYETKTKDVLEDFNKYEEMFDFRNFSSKSKYYDHSSKLIVGEMKDEISGVAIKKFVGLKIYSFSVDDNSEHQKAKGVIKLLLQH